jgi:hypothetical protein
MVWIDVFAVRQFPGNEADLAFDGVIERSTVVILVAQSLPEVAALGGFGGEAVPEAVQNQVAFCRAWCLVELAAAMRHGKPIIMRAGQAAITADDERTFQPDVAMLSKMVYVVNVELAEAADPADKARILSQVAAEPGGFQAMNARIRAAIQSAEELGAAGPTLVAVQAAACGELEGLGVLPPEEHAMALHAAARGGFAPAVSAILADGTHVDALSELGVTPLMAAAERGQRDVVAVLLDSGYAIDLRHCAKKMVTLH